MDIYIVVVNEYDDITAFNDRRISVKPFKSEEAAKCFIEDSFKFTLMSLDAGYYKIKTFDGLCASITDEDGICVIEWDVVNAELGE